MALIELEHVHYRYEQAPEQALDDISLVIEAGEYVLLAGASGSGKSTLCRLLNGLIPHFYDGVLEGRVCVDGLDTREHPVRELFSHVGLVFQNPAAQLFNSTVANEIAFGLESLGVAKTDIQSRVDWALDRAHIRHLKDRAPNTLSGGEQQIVVIAAMLALWPRALVLDEPFANLDPETSEHVRGLLRDINTRGTTVILAEHRLAGVVQDATRMVVLNHGKCVCDGVPRRVLSEDITDWGLEPPFAVQVARHSGWDDVPLSVEEAAARARTSGSLVWPEPPQVFIPAKADTVLKLEDVSFRQGGLVVLSGVTLQVQRGESVALVGRNGSGKTTLLKHVIGIHRPDSGSVTVMNMDTRRVRVSDLARHVGFVFQNPNDQLFKPNVREELEVAPQALGRNDPDWMNRLVEWFDLEKLLPRSPFTLSEGEKKRVAFAAALAAHPDIILLDEPTTGQDFDFRSALERLLKELQSQGATIMFATHDLEFAERVASRWLVLKGGSIAADGAPDSLMQDEEMLASAGLRATARIRLHKRLGLKQALNGRMEQPTL